MYHISFKRKVQNERKKVTRNFLLTPPSEACDKYEACLTLKLTTIKTIHPGRGGWGSDKIDT